MQLTRRTKLIGLGGLGLVFVGAVLKLLVLNAPAPAASVPVVVRRHAFAGSVHAHAAAKHTAAARAARPTLKHHVSPKIDPSLPAPLRTALARHAVVVAVLYAPGVPGDGAALAAARAGAKGAQVGFAPLNVRNEAVAAAIAAKLPGSSDPSVLVVRRPGRIALLINGYVDAAVVLQAARVTK